MRPIRVLCVGTVPDPDGEGFVVDRVQTAAAARAAIADEAVDCVVSAYDLPEGNGLTLLEQLREDVPDRPLPFVLWVEEGTEEVPARALNAGATSYVRADEESPSLEERIEHDVATARQTREGEQFGAVVDTLDDPVYVLDEEGTFVYVNDAFVEQFGYERREILGEHPDHIKDQAGVERAERYLGELLSADGPEDVTFEVEIETADGEVVTCEDHMGVLPYEGERFRGSVGVLRDVTGRKERERELRRYEAFVENTSDAITILDTDGTIGYVSPAAESVFGYDPETLVGRDVREFVHPDDMDRIVDRPGSLPGEPDGTTVQEWRVERPDGSWAWIESTVVNSVDEPAIDGLLVVSRSIDERKAYEMRLEEQRDDLAVLNEILRHDVRNDLQMVFSYVDLLEGEIEGEDATTYLRKIEESARNAVGLTETARDLAAAMEGTETPLEPIDLRSMLLGEVEDLRGTYDGATVTVDGSVPAVTVAADEMLDSVFRNLLQNAVQHNDTGEPTVEVRAERAGDTVTVAVADDGPGVPAEATESIFGKGEKGLESGGTGMGLYLVRTLVDRYGGEVTVADNEPRGAVFTVSLPVAE